MPSSDKPLLIPDDFPLAGWLFCPKCEELVIDDSLTAGSVHGKSYDEKQRKLVECKGILKLAVISDIDKQA